jgi:rSAM/selenodomain-associated transferase 1
MAKVPQAGAVKTRLVPPLTTDEAAQLSICFLRDMTANIAGLADDPAERVILYTPESAQRSLKGLVPDGFRFTPQRGATLGERLANGGAELLETSASVCLINSDSPTLPRQILVSALSHLEPQGDRVVLGPSQDGGYYLIGLKRPHPSLFDRIAWSTAEVLAQTIERAREINLPVELLPLWYDVDDAAALRLLCGELFPSLDGHRNSFVGGYAAPQTRDYLVRLIAGEGGERTRLGAAPPDRRA